MSNNLEGNPFSALFGSVNAAQNFSGPAQGEEDETAQAQSTPGTSVPTHQIDGDGVSGTAPEFTAADNALINSIVEDVFCLTLSPTTESETLVYLEELAGAVAPQNYIDMETLEQALFERLLLEMPSQHVAKTVKAKPKSPRHHAIVDEVLTYLYECHKQLAELKATRPKLSSIVMEMDALVLRNAATAFSQPDLYPAQSLPVQLLTIFTEHDYNAHHIESMLIGVVDIVLKDEGEVAGLEVLKGAFNPVLDNIKSSVSLCNLVSLNRNHIALIKMFSSIPALGNVLLTHSKPADRTKGITYQNTLFGELLSLSCLPRTRTSRYDFFDNPSEQVQMNRATEDSIWTGTASVCECMYSVFHNLLKNSPTSRHNMLSWIGDCLHANATRGKLWNSHAFDVLSATSCASDGFMMNLASVLLRLSQPFTDRKAVSKLLKIDPTYCAVKVKDENEAKARGVHMREMASETCLIPLSSDEDDCHPTERPTSENYGFVTECFFMTQRALDLGMRVVLESLMRLNQGLATLQRAFQDAQAQVGPTAEMVQNIRQRMEVEMTKYLSMRAALLEPHFLEMLGDLHVGSAVWLVQVAIRTSVVAGATTHAPLSLQPVSFPLPDSVPPTLSCVPEYLMENVACYQSMVRRYSPHTLEERGTEFLEPLLTQVLVFMGSKKRMRNPHLRARLAECLESLLPQREREEPSALQSMPISSFNREALFRHHPHRDQIVMSLLDVFVGIEMTGESVAFEQKFNYRRPMYVAMDYLWRIPEHRKIFKLLATEAEANMEAVHPPLFLRFINLLMNDAVFLLDEALTNMAQLRTMQTARENGEWVNLPPREREQNEGYLQHIGMLARFDNILGRETIHTLACLTTEIQPIFSHLTLVDRISAMLNYFLMHLVGPKKKNFKVKDQKEYDFQPAELVMEICRIYVNLGQSDAFCRAVSQDGRSYSPQLFQQAEQVLARIGGGALISDLQQVAERVVQFASQQETEEELLAEAPEEFLDPIMSSLMIDPVILPSSKTTVDRSTIARHLLSDQTDPFNRSPLTMDQVKPNDELREKILAWISERRNVQKNDSSS